MKSIPELPEVETIRRTLKGRVVGARIKCVDFHHGAGLQFPAAERSMEGVVNVLKEKKNETTSRILFRGEPHRRIVDVGRMGKYLFLKLDPVLVFVFDFRMTGRLLWCPGDRIDVHSHTRAVLHLVDRQGHAGGLRFDDQRKFGRVMAFADEQSMDAYLALGPEPIDPSFLPEHFRALLKGRRRAIKPLLLDQRVVSGLGNIYVDEALFRAKILPSRPAGCLSSQEAHALWEACRDVLNEGIAHGGTTFRDYVDGDGRRGGFQHRLAVYGREGLPCPDCRAPITKIKLAGRGTSFCAVCQR